MIEGVDGNVSGSDKQVSEKVLLGPLQVWVRHREMFESFNKEVFVMMWGD